jgi:hypothetical protein
LSAAAAEQVARCLAPAAVGAPLAVRSSCELCFTLELLTLELLRREHPEWARESIDGFFFSSGVKTDEVSAELAGTRILIRDQTVTPFTLGIGLAGSTAFQVFRIRLEEAGDGPLGDLWTGLQFAGCSEAAS